MSGKINRKRSSPDVAHYAPISGKTSKNRTSSAARRALEQAQRDQQHLTRRRKIEAQPLEAEPVERATKESKVAGIEDKSKLKRKGMEESRSSEESEEEAEPSPPTSPGDTRSTRNATGFLQRKIRGVAQEGENRPTVVPVPAKPLEQPSIAILPLSPLPTLPLMLERNIITNYEHNIASIVSFPGDDPEAQIKGIDGKLTLVYWTLKAEGKWEQIHEFAVREGMRLHGLKFGTTFAGTSQIFIKTFTLAESKFRDIDNKLLNSFEEKKRLVKELADALQKEIDLFLGLQRIKIIYSQRYIKDPDHEGLDSFNSWMEDTKEKIDSHMNRYEIWTKEFEGSEDIPVFTKIQPPKSVHVERACSDLSCYCQAYNRELPVPKVQAKILQGRELIKALLINHRRERPNQQELASLCWLLMFYAIKMNAGHHEGTFIIEGGERLFEFLNSSPEVGSRSASHYIGRSPEYTGWTTYFMKSSLHRGIDIPNEPLPALKRTIVFQMVNMTENNPQKVLFLKMENYGTFLSTNYGLDPTLHAFELGASVGRKSTLGIWYGQGGDDMRGMRKERVPKAAIDTFMNLVSYIKTHHRDRRFDLNDAEKKAKLWGISYMHRISEQVKGLSGMADSLIQTLKESFGVEDHLDRRTGREVYLTLHELRKFLEDDKYFDFSN